MSAIKKVTCANCGQAVMPGDEKSRAYGFEWIHRDSATAKCPSTYAHPSYEEVWED